MEKEVDKEARRQAKAREREVERAAKAAERARCEALQPVLPHWRCALAPLITSK